MCQRFEGESRLLHSRELDLEVEGFASAMMGNSSTSNPGDYPFEIEAWDHGYRCYGKNLVPYGVLTKFRGDYFKEQRSLENQFKETGELPEDVRLGLEEVISRQLAKI